MPHSDTKTARVDCCVRGYRVYKKSWEVAVGEELECKREPQYAVAVVREGNVVGHLPTKMSLACSLFIRHGGTINCVVKGKPRYQQIFLKEC